jgi:hypothetical protein
MRRFQTLSSIGQFENSTIRLFNFGASQLLNGARMFGPRAFTTSSSPPEASKAFLEGQTFSPTFESDMWQFGCLVYADSLLPRLLQSR